MSFHNKLRFYRLRAGLTQQSVANRLLVDKTTYSGYETGKRQPDIHKIRALAKILNIPLDDLFETTAPQHQEEEFVLMEKGTGGQSYLRLTPEEYQLTKAMIEALRKNKGDV